MKRPGLGPEYDNFLRLDAVPADAGLAGRCMGALKAGAFVAIAVAIAFIYLDTYAGLRLPRGLSSLAVLAAFFGPSRAAGARADAGARGVVARQRRGKPAPSLAPGRARRGTATPPRADRARKTRDPGDFRRDPPRGTGRCRI